MDKGLLGPNLGGILDHQKSTMPGLLGLAKSMISRPRVCIRAPLGPMWATGLGPLASPKIDGFLARCVTDIS
jgi:hypothetical protein